MTWTNYTFSHLTWSYSIKNQKINTCGMENAALMPPFTFSRQKNGHISGGCTFPEECFHVRAELEL